MDAGSPLLLTKLEPPHYRDRFLLRPRLMDLLPIERGMRLVLLSAPAGYGKTTLLAAWCQAAVQQDDTAVAWVALDEGDNNLSHFLAYLAAAVARALGSPSVFAACSADLHAEILLTRLINMLMGSRRACLLVLDDYHVISAPAVHSAVAFLLEHLPAHVCVAIGSRSDPPLPLARLRVCAQLLELRAADLRFTNDEIRSLVRIVSDWDLQPSELEEIASLIEGWPAGARLVASALRSRADMPESLRSRLRGSQDHLFAYLADEVFDRQPPEIRRFLVHTAVLDRMCGPLCDALLGDYALPDGSVDASGQPAHQPATAMLEALAHADMFLVSVDTEGRWYRYHRLFRRFLLDRLARDEPDHMALLHTRAGAWHACHDRLAHSIEYSHADENGCPLVEPLSEREIAVVRLVAAGASNQTIAATLVISVGTVKSHINHILGKLAAHNRTEAAARARALGLLDA